MRLLYSVRQPGAVFYRDELQALSHRDNSLNLTYALHTDRSEGLAATARPHRRRSDRHHDLAIKSSPDLLRLLPHIVRHSYVNSFPISCGAETLRS